MDEDSSLLEDDGDYLLLQAVEESRRELQDEYGTEEAGAARYDCGGDLLYEGEEARGFDLSAGRTWLYPTNYPVRDYQRQMVRSALFQNTLVCLPTGLGKTFVAAVVMYNFYRWYPRGKVIFLAPTRPLVRQQVEACLRVAGVPRADTAELTGTTPAAHRATLWSERRLFFTTPHVVSNDLSSGVCPGEEVRCLVVDEAHRATGNYSYCQVVEKLTERGCMFRVLALSATPGSDLQGVQQVVDNLRISRLELRSEESLDVVPYIHRREVEAVVVALTGYAKDVQEQFFPVLEPYVRSLLRCKALYGSVRSLTKFRIFRFREEFRCRPPPGLPRGSHSLVEADFAVCITLYHALELLTSQGLRSFIKYLDGVILDDRGQPNVRVRLSACAPLNQLLDEVRGRLGSMDVENFNPDVSVVVPEGGFLSQQTVFSHPKLEKLRDVVVGHFESHDGATTRVMVFCQYRETVAEICHILRRYGPLVRPMSFIGQSSSGARRPGFTQKQQVAVVRKFRSGGYNTLVSTCVGEEGLDIGDVDLIVCFDCHSSPVRLVQRMGRTGRRRDGRIVMLMTEGAEHAKYQKSVSRHRSVSKDMVERRVRMCEGGGPRMVPPGVAPQYHEIFVTVEAEEEVNKGMKGKSMDLRSLWAKKREEEGPTTTDDRILNEPVPRFDRISERKFLSGFDGEELQRHFTHLTRDGNRNVHKGTFSCPNWMEPWKQKTFSVGHSTLSEDLVQLATLIASKKDDLPPQTQTVSRAGRMHFSDLRRNKRKRSTTTDQPPPGGDKRRRKNNKQPAAEGARVFKVPKGHQREASDTKGKPKSLIRDLRSYYRPSGSLAEPVEVPTGRTSPDVLILDMETDKPVVPLLKPNDQDHPAGIREDLPPPEIDEESPQVAKVRELFEELKILLKTKGCRDSRCPICHPEYCDFPAAKRGAVPSVSSIPSEFPDVDKLISLLTLDDMRRQSEELFTEPGIRSEIVLNFRLFDDIDLFLSQLDQASDSPDQRYDSSIDFVNSIVIEKSSIPRSPEVGSDTSILPEEGEYLLPRQGTGVTFGGGLTDFFRPNLDIAKERSVPRSRKVDLDTSIHSVESENDPPGPGTGVMEAKIGGGPTVFHRLNFDTTNEKSTQRSPEEGENVPPCSCTGTTEAKVVNRGPTILPRLNFDTTDAIDQLFEDLDDEGGSISPKLCSGKVLSQVSRPCSPEGSSRTEPDHPTVSPILASKVFTASRLFPACSTPKQPGRRSTGRLGGLRRVVTEPPSALPSAEGLTGITPTAAVDPAFNFTLFLDDLLFNEEEELVPPDERHGTSSAAVVREEDWLQESVEMFTPTKRKKRSPSPGKRKVELRSPPEAVSGCEGPEEARSPDDDDSVVMSRKPRKTIRCLSQSVVTLSPAAIRWETPGVEEEYKSPGGKVAMNRTGGSCLTDTPVGSGTMDPKASSPEGSVRLSKRRRTLKHLSLSSFEGHTPDRSSTPGFHTVTLLSSEDEDFIPDARRRVQPPAPAGSTTRAPPRRYHRDEEKRHDFIEYEAEVSHEGSSNEERVSSSDEEDRLFVNDFPTQASRDMEAEYLRSVRSPPVRGRFKIPTHHHYASPGHRREDVLSDPGSSYQGNSSYEKDSFCVEDEEFSVHDEANEITVLTDDSGRYGETPKKKKGAVVGGGWRRIRAAEDSDDDDDSSK